jgi:hypothetical protein
MVIRRFVFLLILSISLYACGGSGGGNHNDNDDDTAEPVDLSGIDGETGVAVDSTFTYTFDDPVDTSTVTESTFFITRVTADNSFMSSKAAGVVDDAVCVSESAVDADVSCADETTCSVDPSDDLEGDAEYAACITSGVAYADGSSFEGYMASFGTEEVDDLSCTSNADCVEHEGYPTCDTGEGMCVEENFLRLHVASISATPNYIMLRWNPPSETGGPSDERVYIRRADGQTCPDESGGTLVYHGTDQTYNDADAVDGQEYCYRIWYDRGGYEDPPVGGVIQATAYADAGDAAIIWHNQTTGGLYEWRLGNDGARKSYGQIIPQNVSPTSWEITGLVDLDGAREDLIEGQYMYTKDIVWRHKTTGNLYYWLMNVDGTMKDAGSITNAGSPVSLSSAWQIVGLAQLNPGTGDGHDGHGDIVFYNTSTRYMYYWLLERTDDGISIKQTCDEHGHNPDCEDCTHACGGKISDTALSSAWSVVAVGNLLGGDTDPEAEIMFRSSSTGTVVMWLLDDKGEYASNVTVIDGMSTSRRLEAVTDISMDGNADIIWRYSNKVYVSLLDGKGIVAETKLVSDTEIPPSTWDFEGIAAVDGLSEYKDIIWRRKTGTYGLYGWRLGPGEMLADTYTIVSSIGSTWQISELLQYQGEIVLGE